ncbi:SAGA-ASSOCIATED FACTOR 73 [Salix koriyanagi]|uniref:SAGA-ASSOCIATED FACTOR 73 n=1 Tax=Salix koriyanagi TaxID=2511006 RepID=A0A9Q0WLD5_9ROSI|nr:SAGA-ASSOCIATED FACTOR 73 [Salix koriyanagi]
MVCSIGNGRMAVMARLLVAGRLSQNIAEEVSQQKFVTRYNCRELHESDEPNLLDEEDMHVFGLMPMTDPLDLVCCNACKKPVMASQYAAHAELCRLLNSAEEMTLELDGAIGCRKPPRKDRKKLLTASSNQATSFGEQERSETIVADDFVASELQLDGQPRVPSRISLDKKRNSAPVDVASMMDGKGVIPENTDYSACVMPPPTKRNKFISTEHRLLSDDPETAFGLAKVISTVDPYSYIPAPLATKVYYSQRNTHLRSAVAYLHHAASSEGLQNSMMQPQASSQRGSLDAQTDGLTKEKRDPSVHQPDQILVQSSEMFVDKPGGCPALANFSNQCPVDNVLIPQTASIGMLRSKYLPKPYSFAGKPGQSLGTMQQPSGTVPVL